MVEAGLSFTGGRYYRSKARWKFAGKPAKTRVIPGGLLASKGSSPVRGRHRGGAVAGCRRHGRELTGDLRFDEGFAEGAWSVASLWARLVAAGGGKSSGQVAKWPDNVSSLFGVFCDALSVFKLVKVLLVLRVFSLHTGQPSFPRKGPNVTHYTFIPFIMISPKYSSPLLIEQSELT